MLHLQVESNEKLPNICCSDCLKNLKKAWEFKTKLDQSHDLLAKYLDLDVNSVEVDYDECEQNYMEVKQEVDDAEESFIEPYYFEELLIEEEEEVQPQKKLPR